MTDTDDDVAEAVAEQLRAEASELQEARRETEAQQFRKALEKSNGYIARAAALLGIPRSRLSMALAPHARHSALGAWAAKLRAESGWLGGRPPSPARER